VLAQIDNDFEQEIELVRQNQELMQLLEERSKETKTYSLDEVREKLKLKSLILYLDRTEIGLA
jgi:hypothetical protein